MCTRNNLFIGIFIVILTLPLLDNIFKFSPVKELFEKRLPIAKPEKPRDFSQLKNYFKNLEAYYNDNYGFRKTLISINSQIMDKIFDVSPDSRAIIAKEGWMFFDNYNSITDAGGKITIDKKIIDKAVKNFISNYKILKDNNITYVLVIAPDKTSIYHQFLPDYIEYSSQNNHRIDQFLDSLRAVQPDFPVIDLRKLLKNASNKEIVYHQTDTHWNKRGAHYGYVEIVQFLGKNNRNFSDVFKPYLRDQFIDKADQQIKGDISDIMGINQLNLNYEIIAKFALNSQQIKVENNSIIAKYNLPEIHVNDNKNLPILFAYKDSFFGDLVWLLGEHFSKLYAINESPCNIDFKLINQLHADVVIHEFWEGRIEKIIASCKD